MSASDSANRGLAPRVVRVRNRCLAVLSARHSLPAPSHDDLAAIDDSVGLSDAWVRWHRAHTTTPQADGVATRPPARTRTRWRSPVVKGAALVLTGLLGFVVGERLLPRADAQASAAPVEPRWEPVTESAASTLNAKLLGASASDVPPRFSLSPTDMAALILRSRGRVLPPMTGIEARSDSLLWIQGRLRAGDVFVLGGSLRVVRRGIAELRVTRLIVDGRDVDPMSVSRFRTGYGSNVVGDRLRFDVPWFIAGLSPQDGTVEVIAVPSVQGAGSRVSP
jgi:hypothetical protein